jgi:hypothetical protein
MTSRRRLGAMVVALLIALPVTAFGAAGAGAGTRNDDHLLYRWDIISLDAVAATISAGGSAIAIAQDGSSITLTGHGTFEAGRPAGDRHVTGGGTWATSDPTGAVTGSGRYRVISFVQFKVAPGAPAAGLTDLIHKSSSARAGLLFLTVRFSNGAQGVLTLSCHIPGPPPAPESIFEGVRASMGFVDYWNGTQPPPPPSNINRTLFHVLGSSDD